MTKWFVCPELFEKLFTGLQRHALRRFSADKLAQLLPENRSFELWLHCQTISSDLFCNVPLTLKKKRSTFCECRTNKGKCAFKITSLWARNSENLCPASVAGGSLFTAAQAFPENHFSGLMWCSVMAHMLLQKFYCFWLGHRKIHSKPFQFEIYWLRGRKYW